MDGAILFLIIFFGGFSIVMIVIFHELIVINDQGNKMIDKWFNSLSCNDLKSVIADNKETDKGHWLVTDNSKYEKRMEYLNCK